ncbi:hypothetical protein J6590_002953 [Homalodisca vitripennis]|nr:hypothetical protein J6590_002953 [Homalodisca vitripennis]
MCSRLLTGLSSYSNYRVILRVPTTSLSLTDSIGRYKAELGKLCRCSTGYCGMCSRLLTGLSSYSNYRVILRVPTTSLSLTDSIGRYKAELGKLCRCSTGYCGMCSRLLTGLSSYSNYRVILRVPTTSLSLTDSIGRYKAELGKLCRCSTGYCGMCSRLLTGLSSYSNYRVILRVPTTSLSLTDSIGRYKAELGKLCRCSTENCGMCSRLLTGLSSYSNYRVILRVPTTSLSLTDSIGRYKAELGKLCRCSTGYCGMCSRLLTGLSSYSNYRVILRVPTTSLSLTDSIGRYKAELGKLCRCSTGYCGMCSRLLTGLSSYSNYRVILPVPTTSLSLTDSIVRKLLS